MVLLPSAMTQMVESEKRRKQTVGKIKVTNLSRELQMRLQYARLKVDHGWQKQNLNEVENLYFHNSHLRGSKSLPAPVFSATQLPKSPFPTNHPISSQSSLSFKLGSSSLARNSAHNGTTDVNDSSTIPGETSQNKSSGISSSLEKTNDSMDMDTRQDSNPSNGSSTVDINVQERGPPPVAAFPGANGTGLAVTGQNIPILSVTPPEIQSPGTTSSEANHYSPAKVSQIRSQKPPSITRGLSLTAKDMFNFGSSSSLTYDSFWSSHSGSANSRPALYKAYNTTDSSSSFSTSAAFGATATKNGVSPNITNITASSTLHHQQ
ncbi:hypothetical protein CPC08DRAFT_162565 [Agrocybe pediades]|nr:hypothetical protein CPC08DRAFT_162565 [Agrocybe pediades]